MTNIETNWFIGGPLDKQCIDTADILSDEDLLSVKVSLYRWTPKTVKGAKSGRIARIWQFDKDRVTC